MVLFFLELQRQLFLFWHHFWSEKRKRGDKVWKGVTHTQTEKERADTRGEERFESAVDPIRRVDIHAHTHTGKARTQKTRRSSQYSNSWSIPAAFLPSFFIGSLRRAPPIPQFNLIAASFCSSSSSVLFHLSSSSLKTFYCWFLFFHSRVRVSTTKEGFTTGQNERTNERWD